MRRLQSRIAQEALRHPGVVRLDRLCQQRSSKEAQVMTLEEAIKVLQAADTRLNRDIIQPDGGLYSLAGYIHYRKGASDITLDGEFTPDALEAIAVYMRAVR
jgi:hypothetical protein